MLTGDQLTVLSPAYYPDLYPVRYLVKSAERCGIPLRLYGQGKPYHDWMQVQVYDLIEELKTVSTEFVMYVDGSDSIFCQHFSNIAKAYGERGHPDLLFSAEPDGLNAGGWMGRTKSAIAALEYLIRILKVTPEILCHDSEALTNPQALWRFVWRHGLVNLHMDVLQKIFFTMNSGPLMIDKSTGVAETMHRAEPCVLHFCGGYTDPKTGKADQIEPVWERLWCGGLHDPRG